MKNWLPKFACKFNLYRYTEAELVALNRALRDAGVVPVCDIVINHRTADVQVRRASGHHLICVLCILFELPQLPPSPVD